MYQYDQSLRKPYDTGLAALIHEPSFISVIGQTLLAKAKVIKDLGNRAVHDTRPVMAQAAVSAVRELFHFSYWLVRTYAQGSKPGPGISFRPEQLPQMTQVERTTLTRLQTIEQDYLEAEKAQELQPRGLDLEAEIKRLQAEIAAAKAQNQASPDTHDYNEATTRDLFIDLLLSEVGWSLDQPRDREFPVTGMPNTTGEGFADYVLWGDDGKPLAVIEAKRTRKDAQAGQQQAKLYADCLERQFGQRPIIFYSNGYEHWLWDDLNYPPRQVQGFLKKDELQLLHQRRTSKRRLSEISINTDIVERYYQARAIRRVNTTLETDNLRKALLVMATGSGKTRTVIALIDQLMRANWVKRALFLADRVALVNQAINAFKAHLPQTAPVNLVTEKTSEGRIYVSTYPTMMGLMEAIQNGQRRFGPGHFDLIVIDEAHRSVYRKYRAIFDYFDSLLIGLNATPRDEIDRDTYSLFDLETGVPTDAYDLEQAVADGFLVPPRAISVPLRFQREGIRYDQLSDAEQEEWDALEWSEDGTIPDQVDPAALNQWLFNIDTVDKVLAHVMQFGLKVDAGDTLGKTIIFAKNRDHAQFIAERFDANYPHLKGHFARVIDYKTEYAQSLIDDFSRPDKLPQIAISVDMLDTGIDIPEVVNLVFFKLVRSKTKFWQMLGRGTRLCPDLFGPGDHKQEFLVFDFCQNFEFFNQQPAIKDARLSPALGQKLFSKRVELLSALKSLPPDQQHPDYDLVSETLQEQLQSQVIGMSLDNVLVRPHRRVVEKNQAPGAWAALGPTEVHELTDELAALPSAVPAENVAVKQFDYLILKTQLAVLRRDANVATYQDKIRGLVAQLAEMGNIPIVAAEMALILEVQTDPYWQDITLPLLEHLRRRLRGLMTLIKPEKRQPLYTNFEDDIGDGELIELPEIANGIDQAKFVQKVRHFLQQHQDHITIQKLKHNHQLTPLDINELERMFAEAGLGEETELAQIKADKGGLGVFIRSLVGLDREAAKQALSAFISTRNLNANQIEFVNLIIDHLTECGILDPARLYESPFTDFDGLGVSGVFGAADVTQLVQIIRDVNARASA